MSRRKKKKKPTYTIEDISRKIWRDIANERFKELQAIFDGTATCIPLWAFSLPHYRHLLDKPIKFGR